MKSVSLNALICFNQIDQDVMIFFLSKQFTVITLVVMNTLAAPQLRQTTVTSSDVSLLEDDLPNSQSNCRGEHCEDKKETLIKYINTSDKKGYHFT